MNIKIQRTEDLDVVKYLNKKNCPLDPLDLDGENYFWLAYHKNIAVAFSQLQILPEWSEWGFFSRGAVSIDYRGLGIHSRMITVRKRYCKRLGLKGAITYTLTDNAKSARNLVDRGFNIYNPRYPWAGEDVIYFKWTIEQS